MLRWQGQTGVSWAPHGPRYRDLYPVPPEEHETLSCAGGGVIGTVCGVIGSIMATQVAKLLARIDSPQLGTVLFFDGLDMSFRRVTFHAPQDTVAAAENGRMNQNGHMRNDENEIDPAALAELLADGGGPILIDVREPDEHAAGAIAGSRLVPLSNIVTTAQRANQEGGPSGAQQRVAELVAPLSPEQPAILYCEHGVRSAHALTILRQCGFAQLRHLDGGYAAWRVHAHSDGGAG
ncbi:MAG: rhodanese-like domain-containing protein [Mycobacteriales bacterium]